VFAETAAGDRFAFDPDGRIRRLRAGSAERALAGSSFGRWLDATVAREQLLYGPDGEFAPDAFDADGEEVVPVVALRQAERALRADPGSAEAQHERGVALRRLGKPAAALEAFAAATALDPDNPWPWFALGRVALELGDRGRAAEAFRRAAREPSLAEGLRRAAGQAAADGDAAARAEAEALLAALAAAAAGTAPVRLPVLSEPAAPPRPPARPRRPRPAGPPRSGSPRRGGRSRRR
jgi:tetratricopeptide (TPR) repeat protein